MICYLKSIDRIKAYCKRKRQKVQSTMDFLPLTFCHNCFQLEVQGQLIVRSFSPLASAFGHSRQRYSYSEFVSESPSLWMIRASRKRVALLHLAHLPSVSELSVRCVLG